jgi:hypothetical protein
MFDTDGCKAEHDAGDKRDGDADPGNDVGPADVKGGILAQYSWPGQVEFQSDVENLE